MNTQNTPIHVKLWHPAFWCLAIANMLLTMSAYMLVPTLPQWLLSRATAWQTGVAMGIFGLGLFSMGGLCNFLVQRYRRHHVCLMAIIVMLVTLALFYYVGVFTSTIPAKALLPVVILLRFVMGAAFGLSQMVLSSTLVIDVCESFQRTEANHSAAWFARLSISLGPVVALLVQRLLGFPSVIIAAGVSALLAAGLIQSVTIPFKAPDDRFSTFSLDRFLLPEGWLLFINLLLLSTAVGLLFSTPLSLSFYAMLMVGFLLALLSNKYVFADADLKSEAITGLLLIAAAFFIMNHRQGLISEAIPPVFVAFGIGVVCSRFLLFFIKLSRHCQRGTSQSTFFLAWEAGISLGLFLGLAIMPDGVSIMGIALCAVALLLYNFFTHPWYLKHKNR